MKSRRLKWKLIAMAVCCFVAMFCVGYLIGPALGNAGFSQGEIALLSVIVGIPCGWIFAFAVILTVELS